jgi:hypothetical protein
MKRRALFTWTFVSWVVHLVRPQWAWGLHSTPAALQPATELAMLRALAGVVLPSGLGSDGLNAAVERFIVWGREYKAGAEMSAGYGVTQIRVLPADPSASYREQLEDLQRRARQGGQSFAELDAGTQRALLQAALAEAAVETLPRRPDGRHIAADLMSHFYFVSSEGQDWLYNASIRRETCRGLASSGNRPAPLR